MEYLVDHHHKNTTKVIGKACKICGLRIVEGDHVVTKHRRRLYHKACWDAMFIDSRRTASAKWRKSHLEDARNRMREWRKRNPDKAKASRKRQYQNHCEQERAARRKRYQLHCEEERAARKKYYQLHPFKDWTPEEKKKHYAANIRNRRKRRTELAKT